MGLILSLDNSIHSFNRAGFVGLLDQYTGAAAGYSLRRLSVNTTNVVRVRRSSDNAEADFTADEITDGTLLAWVGNTASDNGFVTTWYDQAGSNDATQATAASQPKIVDAGVLVEENGKPAVEFKPSGTNTELTLANNIAFGTNDFYIQSVVKNKTNQINSWFDSVVGGIDLLFINNKPTLAESNIASRLQSLSTVNNTDIYSIGFIRYSGSTNEVYLNGSLDNSATDSTNYTTTINDIGDDEVILQELIIYTSDQSSNRTGIETNINDHYNIYP